MELPPQGRLLLESAQRRETFCGDGRTVWHLWGSGRPVLMLHGGSGSWTHWLRNIQAIVDSGRMAVVPDLPGFGESDAPPGSGDADAVVSPIALGLRSLQGDVGDGPFDVVAFSFGSLVAVLMAAQSPQLVRWLGFVGAPVLPLKRGRGVDLKPWSRTSTAEERAAVHRHNLGAIMLHRPESVDQLALALHAVNVPRDRLRRRMLVTTGAFGDAVAQLQCPFRAIYGEEDALYRGRWNEVENALRANSLFESMTVVRNAGHWVQFEEAQQFNEWMLTGLAAAQRMAA